MGDPPSDGDDSVLDVASETAADVRIREATDGDAPAMADVHAAAIRELGDGADDEQLALTASKNATGFYERRGYERIDTRTLEMGDGVTLPAVRMRKRIG